MTDAQDTRIILSATRKAMETAERVMAVADEEARADFVDAVVVELSSAYGRKATPTTPCCCGARRSSAAISSRRSAQPMSRLRRERAADRPASHPVRLSSLSRLLHAMHLRNRGGLAARSQMERNRSTT